MRCRAALRGVEAAARDARMPAHRHRDRDRVSLCSRSPCDALMLRRADAGGDRDVVADVTCIGGFFGGRFWRAESALRCARNDVQRSTRLPGGRDGRRATSP
ncbi:hypothetical protein WS70_26740 [Burkholderia mayonis]|uniref:Uncharacterized protein n=1 Tax=Burkholderia mayonis TaxID=1385591 RepID=A0A1B4FNS4_9BURK|nr:hypothetical protein WS70_26740 [Burkholderia mayonis]KVE36958.1 hypothetical protein WS69_02020 [Burkholderia sp. BDU5]KVE40696.1 hypothetical protein WS70_16570 [Burkholderia mayonis]